MARSVRVQLLNESYDVLIESGLLSRIGSDLIGRTACRAVAIISDANLPPQHLSSLQQSFPPDFTFHRYLLPTGELNKSLDRVRDAYDALLAGRIDRTTPVIALGGGVTGDLAGFVAATILRGVPLVQVPTTLLSMIDSSVGGKVGVNHGRHKNMIGAFKQPLAVYCDPQTLHTLPRREMCNGLAECIKHAVIRDARLFDELSERLPRAFSNDDDWMSELIARNVAIKARVVEADPFERGEHTHLNFGHTFGHAIETVSNHEFAHGEAVSLGMCAASFLAERLQLINESQRQSIVSLLTRAGLPTSGLDLEDTAVYNAMLHDKKTTGGRLKFVLPDRIGSVQVRDDVDRSLVLAAINSLRGG